MSQIPVFWPSISYITVHAVEVTPEILPILRSHFRSKNTQGKEKSSGIKISLKAIFSFTPECPWGRQNVPSTISENCSWQKQNWASHMYAREVCKGSSSQYLPFQASHRIWKLSVSQKHKENGIYVISLGSTHFQVCHTHFRVWVLENKVTSGTVCHMFLVPFLPPLQPHSKRELLCLFVMCRAKRSVLINQSRSLLSHTLNCWCETHQSSPLFSQPLHSANSCPVACQSGSLSEDGNEPTSNGHRTWQRNKVWLLDATNFF